MIGIQLFIMKHLLHSTQDYFTEGAISDGDQCQTNTQILFYSSSLHGWCDFSVRISWVNYDIGEALNSTKTHCITF